MRGGAGSTFLPSAELYDPATDSWSAASPLIAGRYLHSATLLPDGRVLIAGGLVHGYPFLSLSSVELYNPATDSWSTASPLSAARYAHSATLLPDGRVLIAGGNGDSGSLSSAELYDTGLGVNHAWRPIIASLTSPIKLSALFSVTGSGFRGVGNTEASSGGTNNSATNYPLVQVRSAINEQIQWIVPQNLTATSYKGRLLEDFPAGPAWIIFIVNGIPSLANYVVINEKAKASRFPWPMFIPAIMGNSLP